MTSGFTAIYFFIYAAHYYSSKVIFNIFIILLRLGSPVFNLLVRPWDHKIWQKLIIYLADVGGRCFYNSVFWIHDNYDDICVSIHRFNRFLCMLLVCS